MPGTPFLTPIGTPIGTEVNGIDLSQRLDPATIHWIGDALAEHSVLVFRQQKMNAAQLGAFGRLFGVSKPHRLEGYQHPDFPEVSLVTNVDAQGKIDPFGVKRATVWHSDETYNATLPRLAMLCGLEIPATGGGTLFADMRAAFDGLPEMTKDRIRQLVGLHRFTAGRADARRIYAGQITEAQERDLQDRQYAAVMRHPDNGREILFANPSHTHGFAGIGRGEGLTLIKELAAHSIQQTFIYHHH